MVRILVTRDVGTNSLEILICNRTMQSMVQVCTPIKLEVQEHLVAMVYCAIVVALVLNEEGIIQDLKVHEGIVVFSVFHLFTGMPIIEKSVL